MKNFDVRTEMVDVREHTTSSIEKHKKLVKGGEGF